MKIFSSIWPTVHTCKRSPEKHLFINALQSEEFSKRWLLVYVWTDDDENGSFRIWWCHTLLTLRMLCEGCYLISIGRAKRFKYTTCGGVYFWKRRKTSPPDPDMCGGGLISLLAGEPFRTRKFLAASPSPRKFGRMCALTYRKLRPWGGKIPCKALETQRLTFRYSCSICISCQKASLLSFLS